MKNFLIQLALVALLFSCAPATKEAYLEDYKNFMKELSEESSSYNDSDWKSAACKYKKYSGEWYDLFNEELSVKEKVIITGYKTKFKYLYAVGKTKNAINDIVESDGNNNVADDIEEYIEKDLEDDIEKLGKEVKNLGEELVDEVKELSKELDL